MINIPKLVCEICGSEIKVPKCCNQSMILKEGYLLCCCSEDCGHQPVPKCCGQNMTYKDL